MGNVCHTKNIDKHTNINIKENEKYNFNINLSNFRGKNFKKSSTTLKINFGKKNFFETNYKYDLNPTVK